MEARIFGRLLPCRLLVLHVLGLLFLLGQVVHLLFLEGHRKDSCQAWIEKIALVPHEKLEIHYHFRSQVLQMETVREAFARSHLSD